MNFINKVTNYAIVSITALSVFIGSASAVVDFSALTDLINATMTVLSTILANASTLIGIVILFATLGLVGIIVYGFIGKLLGNVAGHMGGAIKKE